MLAASKGIQVPNQACKAISNEKQRRFMSMQRLARSKRMNLSLGSFRLPGQRSGVAAFAAHTPVSISDGVWENQRFYYAFGWCVSRVMSANIAINFRNCSAAVAHMPAACNPRKRSCNVQ